MFSFIWSVTSVNFETPSSWPTVSEPDPRAALGDCLGRGRGGVVLQIRQMADAEVTRVHAFTEVEAELFDRALLTALVGVCVKIGRPVRRCALATARIIFRSSRWVSRAEPISPNAPQRCVAASRTNSSTICSSDRSIRQSDMAPDSILRPRSRGRPSAGRWSSGPESIDPAVDKSRRRQLRRGPRPLMPSTR